SCRTACASPGPRVRRRRSWPSCRTRRTRSAPCGCCARRCGSLQLPSHSLGITRRCRQAELPLAHDGVDARDVMTDDAQATVVGQLTGGHLEAQVEQLLLGLTQTGHQRLCIELTQLGGGGSTSHQNCSSRVTMRVLHGSLCCARRSASRAVSSFGYDISNRMRPGLTFATHHSTDPLPEPM